MLERIAGLENELRDVEIRLGDPAVQSDQRRLAELGRRHKQLSEIVAAGHRLRAAVDDRDEAGRMHSAADASERIELREMIDELDEAVTAATDELRVLLLPPDPNEGRNVIVEIRGAAGGEEAQSLRSRPVRHVPGLRPQAALEAGAAGRVAIGSRRLHRGERPDLR